MIQPLILDFGNGVKFTLEFPKMRDIIDIETAKFAMTQNMYTIWARSNVLSTGFVMDYCDAAAHFMILLPELKKQLNFDDYYSVDILTAKRIIKVYKEQFYVWYSGIMKELTTDESGTQEN